MPSSTPPHSRRVSFHSEPSTHDFYRLALGDPRAPDERRASHRRSHDSATTVGNPATPAPSSAGLGSPRGSGQSSDPAAMADAQEQMHAVQRLARMPTTQLVAVLRDALRTLGRSQDHIAIHLLLADLGKEMEALVPEDASLDLSYMALSDALLCAEGRHGPHLGDYRRPNAVVRFFLRTFKRQAQ